MKAAIDIGSNTILFLVMNGEKEVCFKSRVCSLGKNLDREKKFDPSSMEKAYKAFEDFSSICAQLNIPFSKVRITATEASRVALNAPEFFQTLKERFSAHIDIISSKDEAYFSALGAVKGKVFQENEIVLMDIGGASTELIKVQVEPFKILESISLPLGSVRVTDWILEGVWEKKKKELKENFSLKNYQKNSLVGVAGTMTALFHIFKDKQSFHLEPFEKTNFFFEELKKKLDPLEKQKPSDWQRDFPFLGKRSEAIWGGYEVCRFLGDELGVLTFHISFQGLVYGLLFSFE